MVIVNIKDRCFGNLNLYWVNHLGLHIKRGYGYDEIVYRHNYTDKNRNFGVIFTDYVYRELADGSWFGDDEYRKWYCGSSMTQIGGYYR